MKYLPISFFLLCFCNCIISAQAASTPKANANAVQLPKTLNSIIRTYPPLADQALKALKRGAELEEKGSHELALAALPDDAAAKYTDLEDYILFYRGRASLMSSRITDAVSSFQALQTRHPGSPLLAEAIKGEAEARIKAGNPQAALALLANPLLQEDAEVLFHRGEASEDAENYGKALECYLRVYTDFADSEFALKARERIAARFSSELAGSKGYRISLSRADCLLRAKRYREALTLLLNLAKTPPDKSSGEKRWLLLAEAEFRTGKASTALAYLKKSAGVDPGLQARARYLEGICNRSLGRENALLSVRDEALKLHPESPFTEQLLYAVATYFEAEGSPVKARDAYRLILKTFRGGAYAEQSLTRVAALSFALKDYQASLSEYLGLLENWKESRSAESALYWIAKCYEKLGDRTHALFLYRRAQTLLNNSYYGQRAREAERALVRLEPATDRNYAGADFAEVSRAVGAFPVYQSSISEPAGPAAQAIERASQLLTAGLPDPAISELRWSLRSFPDNKAISYVMAWAYQIKGDRVGVISVLRRAFPDYTNQLPDSLPREVWDLLFPAPYADIIFARAAQNSLDPSLIFGLIRQESAFDETALSPANARGLMQILPSTGRMLARGAGVAGYSTKMLYRPDANIALGTHYLNSLLKSYNGKVELALAAYNAGDRHVDQWLNVYNATDMDEFVECIPFSETRSYIKQILTNRDHYRLLNSDPSATNH
jgi:soluble lytic murein transglycosylase